MFDLGCRRLESAFSANDSVAHSVDQPPVSGQGQHELTPKELKTVEMDIRECLIRRCRLQPQGAPSKSCGSRATAR